MSELGLDPVVPPPITRRTITLGLKLAPEFVCFPLKVNLGNYVEAIESGAECIFMAGGVGPCRFGYYGELQREILHQANYPVEFLVLEAPKTHWTELWDKIKRYVPKHRLVDLFNAARLAWLKAKALDDFDDLLNRIRPLEKWPGTTTKVQTAFYRALDEAGMIRDIHIVHQRGLEELRAIAITPDDSVLRIILLGEIYMVLEPQVNFQIERVLGEMGVEVSRTIYFARWVYETLFLSLVKPDWRKKYDLLAKPYLSNFVGGHGIETVAYTVKAAANNYHGVIELAPFTCMPEIVAMQVLPEVSRKLSIPVLSVIIDEHAAEAGVRTRLEAFIDLLKHRHWKNEADKRHFIRTG